MKSRARIAKLINSTQPYFGFEFNSLTEMGKVGSCLKMQNLVGEGYFFSSKQIKRVEMMVTLKGIASILCVHLHAWCYMDNCPVSVYGELTSKYIM